MRHEANPLRSEAAGPNALSLQRGQKIGGRLALVQPENDEVGFRGQHLGHVGLLAQHLGQASGAAVVIGQAVHVVFQGIQAGGGQVARLPPPAAHHLPDALALLNKGLRAQQHRAHRRAQALAQAYGYGVEYLVVVLAALAGCHQGIKNPGSIEVAG